MHSVETNTAIQHNQYVVLLNTDNNKTGGFRLSSDILTIYDLDQQRTIVFGAIVSITSSISHLWHPWWPPWPPSYLTTVRYPTQHCGQSEEISALAQTPPGTAREEQK